MRPSGTYGAWGKAAEGSRTPRPVGVLLPQMSRSVVECGLASPARTPLPLFRSCGRPTLLIAGAAVQRRLTKFVLQTKLHLGHRKVLWDVSPAATDPPAKNLQTGDFPVEATGMNALNIPRHKNTPRSVPRSWPTAVPLPGGINVGLFDGHVEVTRLDDLWQLYWHRNYVPPVKRPGLP